MIKLFSKYFCKLIILTKLLSWFLIPTTFCSFLEKTMWWFTWMISHGKVTTACKDGIMQVTRMWWMLTFILDTVPYCLLIILKQWIYFVLKIDTIHLLDEAMSNIKIYSVKLKNIRRGRRPSWIFFGETE